MRNGILTSSLVIKNIKVTTLPNKTIYYEGEEFDPEGMVVTATYPDGSTNIVENYTYYFESNTTAIIVYTEAGVSYTDRITIQINPFDPEVVLVDFVYTNNGNETYTITDWKGTTNGTPGTEIIVPNNPKIIL